MKRRLTVLAVVIVIGLLAAFVAYRWLLPRYSDSRSNSNQVIERWFTDVTSRSTLTTAMNRTTCSGVPFSLPSDGLIGLLWRDSAPPYTILNPHTGIDVFGDGAVGNVPVYAAYDGLLSRRSDWLSSVIIKHDDPLQAGRTIWTYYTHMATQDGSHAFIASAFPAGTSDLPVKRGDLLGYQGEYAGVGRPPIGMHVHMSIVTSEDDGTFKNEAIIGNTLDPSPYFGMQLNIADLPARPIQCKS
ncbi:MAG: M23 family metallopeptidase [Anaerolineae bacterium]|nr:M23 family metallopeptidase [Anaerolineae bacterium]